MARIADLLRRAPRGRSSSSRRRRTDGAPARQDRRRSRVLEPSFVSVTYGALGRPASAPVTSSLRISHEQTFPCMAHLTCVGHSRADIAELLDDTAAAASRTSSPSAATRPPTAATPAASTSYAPELVETVRPTRPVSPSAWPPTPSCIPVRRPAFRSPPPGREARSRRLRHDPVLLRSRRLLPHGRRARLARLPQARPPRHHAGHQRGGGAAHGDHERFAPYRRPCSNGFKPSRTTPTPSPPSVSSRPPTCAHR